MSLSRDNTHSWVRLSHGSNKFLMILNYNETEIPGRSARKICVKTECKRSKAKPQRREPAGSSPRTLLIEGRNWIDIEPGKYSLSEYEVPKKVTFLLLRHSQQVHREEHGAIHFWRVKENLQKHFQYCPHWSDDKWKKSMAGGGGGNKKKHQYCTDASGAIVFSELFKDIQDPILLILHCRTMLLFRATSSSIFTMLDVRSIFILSSTLD